MENSSSQLSENKDVKHNIIMNHNNNQSTKLAIFIIFCIIYFSSYFVSFIISQILEKFQMSDFINQTNTNFKRNSNLIKGLIYGNDLYYNFSENSNDILNYYLNEILKDTEYLVMISSSKIKLDESLIKKILLYDSKNFCSTIKSDLKFLNISSTNLIESNKQILNSCLNYSNHVCEKGMKFIRSYIYKEIKDLSISEFDSSIFEWKSRNLLNSTSVYLFYLKNSEEVIQFLFIKSMVDHFTFIKNLITYISIIYLVGILLIYFGLKSIIFQKNEKQLIVAKGMLKIIPDDYMAKIYQNKKYAELFKELNF